MKLLVFDESGECIWERSDKGGVTNNNYITNGIGHQIRDVLRAGLQQIEGELGMFNDAK
ncbi:MAG: hypothetical protein KA968_14735 [Chitinophagaceae bacterium]|nr:hypothetical protein [Chitinophagaceae bacterium]